MSDKHVPADMRRQVAERARGCCEYCRSQVLYSMDSFSVEHILPASEGGASVPENLAFSCQGCNSHKYRKTQGRDPLTGDSVPLFHPRQQRWSEHFSWDESFSKVSGLTPVGRATMAALHLNREGLVNWRRAMRAFGVHPPEEPNPS
jgi:hypothetical protein